MLVAVVVPTEDHWRAFLMNLLNLWQYTAKDRRSVTIGRVRYMMVNVQYPEPAFGYRADQIIVYSCYWALQAGAITYRDYERCLIVLSRYISPVVYIDD